MALEGYSSLQGMPLDPEDRHTIRTGLTTNSKIQQISPAIEDFKLEGLQEYLVGEVEARWTAEGASKVASGSAKKVIFKPEKLAAAVVETLEASIARPEIAEGLISTAGTSFAKKFDRAVLGLDVTSLNPYFGTFATGLTAVNVTEYSNFIDAQAEIDLDGGVASAIVLTSAAYNSLRRLRNSLGAWEYPGLQDKQNPDIDGVRVVVVSSPTKKGVIGDFAGHSKFGVAVPEFMQVKNAGNITDVNGEVHNLTDSNKVATIIETFVGFNFDDTKYFRELTFTEAPAA